MNADDDVDDVIPITFGAHQVQNYLLEMRAVMNARVSAVRRESSILIMCKDGQASILRMKSTESGNN